MSVFFTSDTHFGHKMMLDPTKGARPFASVEEMDAALIENWNARVKQNDEIHHLGDFAFYDKWRIATLLRQLNGRKYLVLGNHDKELKKALQLAPHQSYNVVKVEPYLELKINKQKIVMFHYPIMSWNGRHRGSWHLHGHSHGNLMDDGQTRRMDVGVDSVVRLTGRYVPISLDEVAAVLSQRNGGLPLDHHVERNVSGNAE